MAAIPAPKIGADLPLLLYSEQICVDCNNDLELKLLTSCFREGLEAIPPAAVSANLLPDSNVNTASHLQ